MQQGLLSFPISILAATIGILACGVGWAQNNNSSALPHPALEPSGVTATPTTSAPADFYSNGITNTAAYAPPPPDKDGACITNFYMRLRVGYQHIYHGDNNDAPWVSAKFYAYGDGLRSHVPQNGWLMPDVDSEFSFQAIPKPDQARPSGSGDGIRLRAGATWPWFRWHTEAFGDEESLCPYYRPLRFALGPTINLGFDNLYNGSDFRLARYVGARLTMNRDAFIEMTVGGTDGLDGTRGQLITELPLYESRNGEVHYYFRGLWNFGASDKPDVLEAAVFLEMPFPTLIRPYKWKDLAPFTQ
ncbi:MAG TPA: hypothetical protein VF988_05535 [Verrucomicrobiae bacterium]